ncbi:hypothetical protein [Croceimicrobium hydrocarbonivorans]|uniref:Uncharacterized protein n=1 Tax=Croceimicrobium hydrocarbonivorans TaxID=2761580 RepID=A0A7H0VH99_9FLAO|nr:hypothetical protein [Croceimicrobium hydrocarbonivorans]QNR25097.1 hypothetical protein H4K34_04470 [Croceimicrobium hydrocarbonivorans]
MKKIISIIILLISAFAIKAQTDTVEIIFNGFYDVGEGTNGNKYYSILFDSVYYENENLQFIRILSLGNRLEVAESLVQGRTYKVAIQRKLQYSCGCSDNLINIRSNRAMTDEGTLFGSNFLEEQKIIAKESTCEYKAIEDYYILEIKNKNGG